MIFLTIILAIVLIIFLIVLGVFLMENFGGSIINDQLIAEYLDKLGNDFSIYHSEYSHRIEPNYSTNIQKCIDKSPKIIQLVFPYNISYIGVIPVWSKSKSRIDAMFATGAKTDWKRKKLGLD